jgi:hypothetical protein
MNSKFGLFRDLRTKANLSVRRRRSNSTRFEPSGAGFKSFAERGNRHCSALCVVISDLIAALDQSASVRSKGQALFLMIENRKFGSIDRAILE